MGASLDEPTSLRAFLLEGVLRFTQSVGGMPGVTRIALVGSLVTEKVMPKDADLLVTVDGPSQRRSPSVLAPRCLARTVRRIHDA